MEKISTATFSGKRGKYSFDVYTIDTEFSDVGAVYIFTKRTVDDSGKGTHKLLYIGQTESFKDRIPNHEKWPCINRNSGNCICIHRDDDEDSMLEKESDLIDGNNTPCND